MLEKNICSKYCICADLKCQAQYNIYHDQIDVMEQASTNFLMSIFI